MRKEYDLSKAKRASEVPHLAVLQEKAKGKSAVTLLLDDELLVAFREKANEEGMDCSALINKVLHQAMDKPTPKAKPLR